MAALSPQPMPPARNACEGCRNAARDEAEIDVYRMTPVAIVRAEMLAAVDELMDTFRARG